MSTKGIMLGYIRKHWPRYVLGMLFLVGSSFCTTAIPKVIGIAVDRLRDPSLGNYAEAALLVGAAGVGAFVLRFCWRYLILSFTRSVEKVAREALFAHLQELSADYYVKNNSGDIITRLIIDTQAIRRMLGFAMTSSLDAVVVVVSCVVYMVTGTNWLLTALAVLPIPFVLWLIIKIRFALRRRQAAIQEAVSDLASKVQENIGGIRVVKAFALEQLEEKDFAAKSSHKWDTEMKKARISALPATTIQLVFGVVFSVFLIVGAYLVADGSISIGDYTAFNGYIALLSAPVSSIGRIVEMWQTGMASIRRMDDIFAAVPAVDDRRADPALTELADGSVRFSGLTFTYPGKTEPDLRDITLDLPAGRTLAVMGETGSGKTTLLSLIERQWETEEGQIFVGGRPLQEIPLHTLHTSVAPVPQDTFLFSDTIEENIRFYDPSVTMEDIEKAAKAAAVHDSIMSFPAGYQTVVGERGMTLSGGQKQRIALARALVRRPKLLLLDDCLSAVDAETEQLILSGIREYLADCTAILVTHRATAAAVADRILVLSPEGGMAECGTHAELMALDGIYRQMYENLAAKEEERA